MIHDNPVRCWNQIMCHGVRILVIFYDIKQDAATMAAHIKFIFFFWAGFRDPIACSLLGSGIPAHNSGYKFTKLCPYSMLGFYFVPPPSLPARYRL